MSEACESGRDEGLFLPDSQPRSYRTLWHPPIGDESAASLKTMERHSNVQHGRPLTLGCKARANVNVYPANYKLVSMPHRSSYGHKHRKQNHIVHCGLCVCPIAPGLPTAQSPYQEIHEKERESSENHKGLFRESKCRQQPGQMPMTTIPNIPATAHHAACRQRLIYKHCLA